jgi:hypothetical protein
VKFKGQMPKRPTRKTEFCCVLEDNEKDSKNLKRKFVGTEKKPKTSCPPIHIEKSQCCKKSRCVNLQTTDPRQNK